MSKFENRIQKDLVTDPVFTEANEEFILPDYMPEIGRVLRVSASLLPEECYLGSDAAEFAGRVEYRLLYSDSEGTVTEAPLEGRYRYRMPHGEKKIVTAYTDEVIESVSARPSAPRKLGIRTRIAAMPHLLYEEEIGSSVSSLVGECDVETREGEGFSAEHHALPMVTLHMEERFTLEGIASDALSFLSTESSVLLECVEAHDGYISVRGRISVPLILKKAGCTPFVKMCTLPFEEDITAEGCRSTDTPSLRAFCAAPAVSFEEAGEDTSILLDTECSLFGIFARNVSFPVLEDLYVHGAHHVINRRPLSTRSLLGCYTGNMTVDGELPLPAELSAEGRCLVPHFTVKEHSTSHLAERAVVTGTLGVLLLSLGDGEGEKAELSLPFRIEFPIGTMGEEEARTEVFLSPVGGEAYRSGGNVRLSTELAVTARAHRAHTMSLPVSATKTEDIERNSDSAITVYYPTDGDTLWSVGKKYAMPLSVLRKQNGLPPEEEPDADKEASLDGYSYLLIDGL